jgi:hypothetical protein
MMDLSRLCLVTIVDITVLPNNVIIDKKFEATKLNKYPDIEL